MKKREYDIREILVEMVIHVHHCFGRHSLKAAELDW